MDSSMLHIEPLHCHLNVDNATQHSAHYLKPSGQICSNACGLIQLEPPASSNPSDSSESLSWNDDTSLSKYCQSPISLPEQQDGLVRLRLQIQDAFLSYRSPGTTPRRYVSNTQLMETFKDLTGPTCSCQSPKFTPAVTDEAPNHSTLSVTVQSDGKAPSRRPSTTRCECEGVYGVVEMRYKKSRRHAEKVKCVIQSVGGKLVLSVFGGSDFTDELGFIQLQGAYVTAYPNRPVMFAVGLRVGDRCIDDSEMHFSCHTHKSRDLWLEALLQSGCTVKGKRAP
eukprot:758185-Hanusia_phi.AAC.5